VVSEATLKAIVKEWRSTGPVYRSRVQTRIRGSYRSHYRRMLAPLLNALTFRSNNERHRPVIEALTLLKRYSLHKVQYYPAHESVPIDGVVPSAWRDQAYQARGSVERLRSQAAICLGVGAQQIKRTTQQQTLKEIKKLKLAA
jgi:hypothetical protein